MTVKDEASKAAFAKIYANRNPFTKKVKGCLEVKVMKDADHDDVIYTVSLWEAKEDLEAYRNSNYFAETWPMVKKQLAKRAEAFSLEEL